MYVTFNFHYHARTPFNLKIEEILQVQPKLRVGLKVTRQAQGGIGGYAAAFVHDFTNASGRHVEVKSQSVNSEAQRLHEILAEDLSGMNRGH